MSSSKTVSLGTLLKPRGYIRGPFGSALRRPEMKKEGVPVYEQQNVIYNNRNFRFFVDSQKQSELKRFTVEPNDLLVSCSGTLGRITVIRKGDPTGIISQALLILRPDSKKVLPDFLYYFLTSPEGQYLLLGASHGSVQVNMAKREVVEGIQIPKLEISEQEKIVEVLAKLDRKIELNRKINKNLEEIGQALFKHYFIENPDAKNWEKKPLDEIADFLNGLASQKYPAMKDQETLPVIKIREMSGGVNEDSDRVSIEFPKEYIIENGDFLFAWSGTLMTKIWTEGKGALNQHIFKVTSKDYPKWLYYYWTNHYLQQFVGIAKSKAVTMGHIKRSHLSEAIALVPPKKFIDEINNMFQSNLNMQIANSIQISTLSTIRDSILPKLINGDIEV